MNALSLLQSFQRGDYGKILDRFDASPDGFPERAYGSLAGAFAMQGRMIEAEGIVKRIEQGSGSRDFVEARFWLGVGLMRSGEYERAGEIFQANLRFVAKKQEAHARFWAEQGLSFFHSYLGQYAETKAQAERALLSATQLGNNYCRVLALDLLGQAMVNLGEVRAGLAVLDRALSLAKRESWTNLHRPIKLSRSILSVQFGQEADALLLRLLRSADYPDSYSQSYLELELARQAMLQGRTEKCRGFLASAAKGVRSSRNRRQSILLALRLAHLEQECEHLPAAEKQLAEARALLQPGIDNFFLPMLLDLEHRLAVAKGDTSTALNRKKELVSLCGQSPTAVHLRILRRRGWINSAPATDDRIADLIDAYEAEGEPSLPSILENGHLSFLRKILKVPHSSKLLWLDLEPGKLTVFSPAQVQHLPSALSRNQRRLLLGLADSLSRAALVKSVWGYEYHPLRHDSLVYAAVNKLRSTLGPVGDWVESGADGYSLQREVSLRLQHQSSEESAERAPLPRRDFDLALNHRQRGILIYLENHEMIAQNDCMRLFRVSAITASRDLSFLLKQKYLVRTGKARATKYHRNSSSSV